MTHMYTCIHIHIHTYIHLYTYMHICTGDIYMVMFQMLRLYTSILTITIMDTFW